MKSRVKRISATTAVVATLVSGLIAISAPAQASAPTSWNQVDSTGFYTDVAYGRGLFVAVGISQSNYPQVKTSPNGRDWTTRTVPGTNTTFQWQSIAYGDGVFVAVGFKNPTTWARNAIVMRSTDGINWSLVSLPPAMVSSMAIIKSIAYGNRTFTAVGRFGGSMHSTDFGLTWTQSSTPPDLAYNSITFGNGLFVALASGSNALNATKKIVTSPNGITWTQQTTPDSEWSDITFGNGLFVAVASAGTERIMTSSDGITWTSRTAPSTNQWTGITYGRDLFVAVASSSTSTSTIMTSLDGITWTARTAITGGWNSITYGPDVFVVTRSSISNALMYSGTPNPTVSAPSLSHVFGQSVAAVTGVKVEGSGSTIGTISCGAFEDSGFTTPITTSTRPGLYYTRCTGPVNSTSGTPSNVKPIIYSNGIYQVDRPTGSFTYPVLTKEYGDTFPFIASSALSGAYVNSNFTGLVAGDVIETATTTAWTFSGNAHLETATAATGYTYRLNFSLVNYKATSGALGTLASTYNITQSPSTGGSIRINKAPLTVSPAATETITVGSIVPETFTATYSGWKAGESQNSSLAGWRTPVCTAPSVPVDANRMATVVGTYTITCSGGLATNYAFTYVAGTFVVLPATPATTTITATNETSTVGSPIASISYTMTNLASGDWIPAGTEFSCDAYDGSNLVTSATKAGTYASKCTGPAYTGQGKNISYVSGTYLVNKAPLTLTALNRNKVYGDLAAAGTASNVAVTGLVNGDTVTVSFAYSGGGPLSAGSGGGTYTITPSATLSGGRTLSEFYDVTVNTGTFTVDKTPLRVRANDGFGLSDQPKGNYLVSTGSANAPQYYGFKNSETSTALTTPATCFWNAVPTTDTGTAGMFVDSATTIVCSGAASNNYSFTYEVASFPVRGQAIWVRAANGTSVYGSSLAGVTDYSINALNPWFTELNTTRRNEISCVAFRTLTPTVETLTSSAAPGTYTVRCTGPAKTTDNFDIFYEPGVYTITKPTLTIKANDRTRIYGNSFTDGVPSDSTVTGLVGSDTVTATYTYSAVQDSATAVGRYTITPVVTLSGDRNLSDFYQVILANGVSSVTPLKVQVAAQNLTNVKFGSTPPTSYTYTIKKLDGTNVPTADVFTVAPTCTSGFSSTTPRGTVLDIVCSGGTLVAANYEVEFIKGTLEVEPVPLTVGSGTSVKTNTTSGDPRVDFTAKATTGNWVAGCKVSWTLDPSAGTGSTYEAYPGTALLGTNNDLVLNAPVPYGVYNVTMSLSGNCSGASVQSVLVVAPNTVGTDSRTIGSGTYTDARTSNTVNFSFEWQKSGSTFTTPFTWTVADRWRINSTLGSQVTLVGMDGTSTSTSTWGRNDCPATLVGTCSTLIGQVMLQRWAPNWRLAAGGYWVDFGLVSMTMRVAETTSGADQVSMQLRQVPGSRAIPSRVPTSLWVALQSGSIQHLS